MYYGIAATKETAEHRMNSIRVKSRVRRECLEERCRWTHSCCCRDSTRSPHMLPRDDAHRDAVLCARMDTVDVDKRMDMRKHRWYLPTHRHKRSSDRAKERRQDPTKVHPIFLVNKRTPPMP